MAQAQGSTSTPPPAPRQSAAVLAWAREMTKWARKTQVIPGSGIISRQTEGGRVFNAAGGGVTSHPFKITRTGPLEVQVNEGYVIGFTQGAAELSPRMVFTGSEKNAYSGQLFSETVTVALTNNATNYFYARVMMLMMDQQTGGIRGVDSFATETIKNYYPCVSAQEGTVVIFDYTSAQSLFDDYDPETPTRTESGFVFFPIGEVVTSGGAITGITQTQKTDIRNNYAGVPYMLTED